MQNWISSLENSLNVLDRLPNDIVWDEEIPKYADKSFNSMPETRLMRGNSPTYEDEVAWDQGEGS